MVSAEVEILLVPVVGIDVEVRLVQEEHDLVRCHRLVPSCVYVGLIHITVLIIWDYCSSSSRHVCRTFVLHELHLDHGDPSQHAPRTAAAATSKHHTEAAAVVVSMSLYMGYTQ